MRYDVSKDPVIMGINIELAQISELRETINTRGWQHVLDTFVKHIHELHREILDKCDKPTKYEMEIKCRKMVAKVLGDIMATMDNRVKNENYLKQEYNRRSVAIADAKDRQELAKL